MHWLRRLLGWECCGEFTQWETFKGDFSRPATMDESIWAEVTTVEYTRRWQERRCTICGKIQQRDLR